MLLIPDSTTDKSVTYRYGRDGIKWLTNDIASQMYLIDDSKAQLSLLGSAPTETDIRLGLSIAEGKNYAPQRLPAEDDSDDNLYTFSLPEPEAFRGYDYVWVIDYKENTVANLLEKDYQTRIEPGNHNNRFAVRIGRFPIAGNHSTTPYDVYTSGGNLRIKGLNKGDRIYVYSASGMLVCSAVADGFEYSTQLLRGLSYVVRINNFSQKVVNP